MNKVRPMLIRSSLRAVLGQATPRFELQQVFSERKILLVNLAKGLLGPEASALLGSIVVAQLWQVALERSAIPAERRHPVFIFLDEFQDFLNLPIDLADALAQARGLGLGLTLAHQHLGQLSPQMRSAVLANARSRVVFQLAAEDARTFAGTDTTLSPEDFRTLAGSSRSIAERTTARRSFVRRVSTRATTAQVSSRPLTASSLGLSGSLRTCAVPSAYATCSAAASSRLG